MRSFFTLKLETSLFMAIVVFLFVYCKDKKKLIALNNMNPQYDSFPYLLSLPGYLCFFYVATSLESGSNYEETNQIMFSICFILFLDLTIYYVLLLTALPLLRAQFRARTCAVFWLLPCTLCIFFMPSVMEVWSATEPLWAIPVSASSVSALSKIWAVGFFAVLIWKIASHIRFREGIEGNAQKITDPEILRIWEQEQQVTGEYPLLISPILQSTLVQTPLSIGVFKSGTILVLPQKEYSPEELELIFRHEIIHIQRRDGATKFFLAFCAALCWFNPLMWKGIRRSAEDMELSCDEAVVQNYDDKSRRHQYAKLLLETAGDERGFTSCLAANASALRYRLANIIAPRSRKSGALLAALITFGMLMSIGCVGLSIQ